MLSKSVGDIERAQVLRRHMAKANAEAWRPGPGRPYPETADEARRLFTCHRLPGSAKLYGAACARRWQPTTTGGGVIEDDEADVYNACIGCQAGEARRRLLHINDPRLTTTGNRYTIETNGPFPLDKLPGATRAWVAWLGCGRTRAAKAIGADVTALGRICNNQISSWSKVPKLVAAHLLEHARWTIEKPRRPPEGAERPSWALPDAAPERRNDERIEKARTWLTTQLEAQGVSQRMIAQSAGVRQKVVSEFMRGIWKPSAEALIEWALSGGKIERPHVHGFEDLAHLVATMSAWRDENGFTNADAARALGVDRQTWVRALVAYQWSAPRRSMAKRLAQMAPAIQRTTAKGTTGDRG